MTTTVKILIVAALALGVAGIVVLKKSNASTRLEAVATNASASAEPPSATGVSNVSVFHTSLPRLVDLGADKCIPCKMMFPVLEELKTEYAGRMNVEFIDVWRNPDAGRQYGVEVIPTQIFFDAAGNELFRHQGFFAKEDIVAKWRELGVPLNALAPAPGVADKTNATTSRINGAATNATVQQVIAYYFHGNVRCDTCLAIEKRAKEIIEQQFKTELESKRLVFKSVNYDQPENAHFSDDYKLPYPSLVLVGNVDGKDAKWILLEDTWKLIPDQPKFDSYVKDNVRKFLGK